MHFAELWYWNSRREREREAVLLVVGVLEIQHHSFTFTS